MEKTKQLSELTILQLMEELAEKSKDSCLGEDFWNDSGAFAAELATRLSIRPRQVVLLSICLLRGPRRVDFYSDSGSGI